MKNVSTLGKSDYEDNFYMHHIKLISPNLKAVGDPKSDLKGGQFGRPSDLQKLFVRRFCPLCKNVPSAPVCLVISVLASVWGPHLKVPHLKWSLTAPLLEPQKLSL